MLAGVLTTRTLTESVSDSDLPMKLYDSAAWAIHGPGFADMKLVASKFNSLATALPKYVLLLAAGAAFKLWTLNFTLPEIGTFAWGLATSPLLWAYIATAAVGIVLHEFAHAFALRALTGARARVYLFNISETGTAGMVKVSNGWVQRNRPLHGILISLAPLVILVPVALAVWTGVAPHPIPTAEAGYGSQTFAGVVVFALSISAIPSLPDVRNVLIWPFDGASRQAAALKATERHAVAEGIDAPQECWRGTLDDCAEPGGFWWSVRWSFPTLARLHDRLFLGEDHERLRALGIEVQNPYREPE